MNALPAFTAGSSTLNVSPAASGSGGTAIVVPAETFRHRFDTPQRPRGATDEDFAVWADVSHEWAEFSSATVPQSWPTE